MKNIVHVVDSLERGGQETFLIDLAVCQKANGDNPSIVCIESAGVLEKKANQYNIPVIVIGKSETNKNKIKKLAIEIKSLSPNIIHTHNRRPLIFSLLALPRYFGKIINTRHGNAVRGAYWTIAASMIKAIVNVSSDLFSASSWYNRTCLSFKNKVIENGIPISEQCCSDIGIGQLVMVGRLSKVKNHFLALDVINRCVEQQLSVKLTIIGDGPEKGAICQRIKQLELEEYVNLLGDRNDVLNLLAKSDIFLFTSLSEGHSIALLEACSVGLPAVVSNVGGNGEIITNGANGFLLELEDIDGFVRSIRELIENRELWRKMSENSRKNVIRNYSIESCRRQYDSLYER